MLMPVRRTQIASAAASALCSEPCARQMDWMPSLEATESCETRGQLQFSGEHCGAQPCPQAVARTAPSWATGVRSVQCSAGMGRASGKY